MKDCHCHIAPYFEKDRHLTVGTKEYLTVLNAMDKPIETLPVKEARDVLSTAQSVIETDLSGIEESVKVIVQDGFEVKLNIIRPAGVEGSLPVFVFVHGGGWALGDYPTHKRLVRDLVVASGMACVFPNYSRSPEARFPRAVNEVYASIKWVYENGENILLNGKELAITGNSAGGNMAIAASLMAKDNNGPEIKCQVLLWPVTDSSTDYDSYTRFGQDRFLTTTLMEWMFNQYTKDPVARKDIHISPVLAVTEQLKGLPPTLIAVAENDILRDQGELLGRKLDVAGVDVTTIRFNGVIHDWGLLNGFAKLPPVHTLITFVAATFKEYLKRE
ncbi:MAG: alpha/beta hydrolase [Tannerellaceae bacterium]|nr:alpha/beta hydrolase [Tannerellaceae bacterium]